MDGQISKVQDILTKADLELRSIEVNKPIQLEVDLGNLLVTDVNELDKDKFRSPVDENEYLKEITRDGTQFLLNKIWNLPSETLDNMVYVILPEMITRLPREKPVPKPKPMTKWEEYAKQKGIKKKKKGNIVWDDVLKDWIPRYGKKKVEAEKKKNWLIEVPNNADPYEDQFAKAAEAKNERIARNEYLRLKNIAKAKKINVPNVGVTSINMKTKSEMTAALTQTRISTASLGKFQKSLPKEKPLQEERMKGRKRKLPYNDTTSDGIRNDQTRSLKVLKKMKKDEIDYESAVNKQIKMDNIEMSHTGKKKSSSGRRSKHGGRKRGKSEQKALALVRNSKSKTQGKKSSNFGLGGKTGQAGKPRRVAKTKNGKSTQNGRGGKGKRR